MLLGPALLFDIGLMSLRGMQAMSGDSLAGSATGAAMGLMEGGPTSDPLPSLDGRCVAEGPCIDAWYGRRESDVAATALDVTWRWEHAGCHVAAVWTVPLLPGAPTAQLDAGMAAIDLSSPPDRWAVGLDAP